MIISLIGFVVLFLLAFSGVPLAFAMLLVGTVGFGLLRGDFEFACEGVCLGKWGEDERRLK